MVQHPFFCCVTELQMKRNRITLVNIANTVIFGKRKTNGVYTKISQKLRTFYRIKISVIEKKLQPSENDPQNPFFC